jgi:hypothetical protein
MKHQGGRIPLNSINIVVQDESDSDIIQNSLSFHPARDCLTTRTNALLHLDVECVENRRSHLLTISQPSQLSIPILLIQH